MIVTKRSLPLNANILLDRRRIRNTDNYIYLGSKITKDGGNDTIIVWRIGMAKKTLTDMNKFLANLSIDMKTKIRMLKSFVWSVSLYGSETW